MEDVPWGVGKGALRTSGLGISRPQGIGCWSNSFLEGDLQEPRLVLPPVPEFLGSVLSPREWQRSKAGRLPEVLGGGAETLPGICILSLQLMSLKALPHLFLAANVPAKNTGEWRWGAQEQGHCTQSRPLWLRGLALQSREGAHLSHHRSAGSHFEVSWPLAHFLPDNINRSVPPSGGSWEEK